MKQCFVWHQYYTSNSYQYSAFPLSPGHFSPNNSQKTLIAHPWGSKVPVTVWHLHNSRHFLYSMKDENLPKYHKSQVMKATNFLLMCVLGWLQCSKQCLCMMSKHGNSFCNTVMGIYQSPVYFPIKGTVTWSFDVFFVACLNKLLNKQLSCQWFEISSNKPMLHQNWTYADRMFWF